MTNRQNQCHKQLARIGAPAPLEVLAYTRQLGVPLANASTSSINRIRKEMKMLNKEGYQVELIGSDPLSLIASKGEERYEFFFPEPYPFKSPVFRQKNSAWFVVDSLKWSPAYTLADIILKMDQEDFQTIQDYALERDEYKKNEAAEAAERENQSQKSLKKLVSLAQELEECKRKLKQQQDKSDRALQEIEDLRNILRAMGAM